MEVYKVTARVTSEPAYIKGETISPQMTDNFGTSYWEVSIRIKAEYHRQHVWDETSLVGVSRQGMRRIDEFATRYGSDNLAVDVGKRRVRLSGCVKRIDCN